MLILAALSLLYLGPRCCGCHWLEEEGWRYLGDLRFSGSSPCSAAARSTALPVILHWHSCLTVHVHLQWNPLESQTILPPPIGQNRCPADEDARPTPEPASGARCCSSNNHHGAFTVDRLVVWLHLEGSKHWYKQPFNSRQSYCTGCQSVYPQDSCFTPSGSCPRTRLQYVNMSMLL